MGAIVQIERDLLSGNHARQLRGSQFAAPFQTPLTDQPEEFLAGRCDGSKGGGAGADDAVIRRDNARVAHLQTLRCKRSRRGARLCSILQDILTAAAATGLAAEGALEIGRATGGGGVGQYVLNPGEGVSYK